MISTRCQTYPSDPTNQPRKAMPTACAVERAVERKTCKARWINMRRPQPFTAFTAAKLWHDSYKILKCARRQRLKASMVLPLNETLRTFVDSFWDLLESQVYRKHCFRQRPFARSRVVHHAGYIEHCMCHVYCNLHMRVK